MTRVPLLFLAFASLAGARCGEGSARPSALSGQQAKAACAITSGTRLDIKVDSQSRVRVCGSVDLPLNRVYGVVPQIIVRGDTLVVVPVVEDLGPPPPNAPIPRTFNPVEFFFYYGPLASNTKLRVTTLGGPRLPAGFMPADTVVIVP